MTLSLTNPILLVCVGVVQVSIAKHFTLQGAVLSAHCRIVCVIDHFVTKGILYLRGELPCIVVYGYIGGVAEVHASNCDHRQIVDFREWSDARLLVNLPALSNT